MSSAAAAAKSASSQVCAVDSSARCRAFMRSITISGVGRSTQESRRTNELLISVINQ